MPLEGKSYDLKNAVPRTFPMRNLIRVHLVIVQEPLDPRVPHGMHYGDQLPTELRTRTL